MLNLMTFSLIFFVIDIQIIVLFTSCSDAFVLSLHACVYIGSKLNLYMVNSFCCQRLYSGDGRNLLRGYGIC
jgi:hypothetical protein